MTNKEHRIDDDPPPAILKSFDEAAAEAAVGQLDAVRATAEKWAGTVTALLGVSSSVALVAGTDSISEIGNELVRGSLMVAISLLGLL